MLKCHHIKFVCHSDFGTQDLCTPGFKVSLCLGGVSYVYIEDPNYTIVL